ncbi:MAG: hypothetical protein QOI73_2932, partial [Solirubrobacteraceae bacterium]|nr:hypothetical protein [Solirubrobacteraceae bacterium]
MDDARCRTTVTLALGLLLAVAATSFAAPARPVRRPPDPAASQGPAPAGDPGRPFDSRRGAAA